MEVISTRRYEARPPASSHNIVYDPENSIATVKEEEWETRKKKEITTTRQIETRVKRQVVLEDGEIVVDSGPLVTTNTTEDVEQQEHTTQERRTTGDEPQEVEWPSGGKGNGAIVQKELNETVVRSREEIEERLETEDRQQLGDISDEAYQQAVRTNRGDLRVALAESSKQLAVQPGPRILQHTTRSNKVVDTENTLERSELKADGLIVTESKKTVEHEEVKDDELPEDAVTVENGVKDEATETRKESSQRFVKRRDEDVVDYVSGGEKIAREMRYVSETTEGERIGDWPPPPNTMRTTRLHKHTGFGPEATTAASRKDAVTKKPLDLEEEDEARKFETSKWLESHFGSESRSSHGSVDADDPPIQTGTNTSFINVTMKSCTPARSREYTSPEYNTRHQHRRTSGRDSSSPSGYFHGISEWSERYQTNDKSNTNTRTASPSHYVIEAPRSNGYKQESPRNQPEPSRIQKESAYPRPYEATRRQSQPEQDHRKNRHEQRHRDEPPSPPVRRRIREQIMTRSEEKNSYNEIPVRTASPILVVQRTWENRSKDVQQPVAGVDRVETRRYSPQNSKTPPRTRSPSPAQRIVQPSRREKKSIVENTEKSHKRASPAQSKYKIGESFRKLVGKLRSASSERKSSKQRPGSSSTSQLTQTDDDSTYRQYNVIDRNIPLVTENNEVDEDRPPERPPRSPRNNNAIVKTTIGSANKLRSNGGYSSHEAPNYHRNNNNNNNNGNTSTTPVQRYYVGEQQDPYAVSNRESYSREKVYREVNSKPHHGRPRGPSRNGVERDYSNISEKPRDFSVESNSLGRYSKSTSRLTNDYERDDHFRSVQTLPRKLHSVGNATRTSHSSSRRHLQQQQPGGSTSTTTCHIKKVTAAPTTTSQLRGNNHKSRQYGSMINISIKNAVTSQNNKPNNNNNNNKSNNNNNGPITSTMSFQAPPAKPERTYKSSLLRSKSFNVVDGGTHRVSNADTSGGCSPARAAPYKSNLQLNRLDETPPPLKSPGILASISRSNRDLFKAGRHE